MTAENSAAISSLEADDRLDGSARHHVLKRLQRVLIVIYRDQLFQVVPAAAP